ncbi:DegT/DnrJ/EryC1/StrS family aminotransferase [Hymenobacter sp. YC55]|uniref:DegT/DnrJ/EryC1/StrS family aminotransferase n=1 Tax=Hymenobacter sp. YC55 TaxID=3034019 RepID=UPI0023F8A30B|nr:DegT/DnrJ/EryC1/StrS family aminotransferase [Hymenobacter sp. YC55]MDF7815126.1 DegT/DnrJ/EryC1/StrS family aminotransferase [Hymenobacter sp. YC55]
MIYVTHSYLPPLEEYVSYLTGIWERNQLTNNGPLLLELEGQLSAYMGGPCVQFTSNGTIALQLAIQALNLTGEIITTPFSYVATTSVILWEKCTPVYVDIEEATFCIDADKIEAAITPRTSAILATHVYGYPCDVVKIEAIAQRHQLKVIYDGAHAFGTKVAGRSLLTYGDLTACSFHATKLFHTGEGGALIAHTDELAKKIWLLKSFGHFGDDHMLLGINGKNSEFHAALGLCMLPRVTELIATRAQLYQLYHHELAGLTLRYPVMPAGIEYNYAYFPVVFENEAQLLDIKQLLAENEIDARRYFFPSLNHLPYAPSESCPVAEDIATRVLCLPFYPQLPPVQVRRIAGLVRAGLTRKLPVVPYTA